MAKQCQLCKQTPLRFSEAKKLNKDTLCWLEAVSEEKISPQSYAAVVKCIFIDIKAIIQLRDGIQWIELINNLH